MYGLVNKAIEELVSERFGKAAWEKVLKVSGIEEDGFVSNQPYDDAVTYKLVEAAVEILGLSSEEVLKAFGEHWVLQTATKGYGPMLDAAGSNLVEFLNNLPGLHTRVALIFPELKPPRFDVTHLGEGELTLHYWSDRPGLDSMVKGLMIGLGKRFNQQVEVVQTVFQDEEHDHAEFLVKYAA
ncbi:MAG: heme NO-binding domain-containing protein [Polyangiaceae bacterium]|nr:heme NO-binding domain-containing protein [Polyangiaceae bacterium]